MRKSLYTLSILTIVLAGLAVALWLLPTLGMAGGNPEKRYGVYEGLELVYARDANGESAYFVDDAQGNRLFAIPLYNSILDVRYRGGQLRFRDKATSREGYIDTLGKVVYLAEGKPSAVVPEESAKRTVLEEQPQPLANKADAAQKSSRARLPQADLRHMARTNPFYHEATKVLSGKLAEKDSDRRRVILNYCEHLRTAYTTKDIDFLRQVFSDNALIIVGNVIRARRSDEGQYLSGERVSYNIRTKKEYVARLSKAFAANKQIDVKFTDFRIMRHPTMDGIYGVTLRQRYASDQYTDDGYLFLLWDFRDKSMPCIHVRTWQPAASVSGDDEVINITDFNLQ